MKVPLIAFSGQATAGKSTAAQALVKTRGFARVSFAQPLRVMLGAILSPNELAAKTEVVPWLGKTPRELMQTLGTEWGRNLVNDQIWVRAAERKLKQLEPAYPGLVVDDCRFDNEAKLIHDLGGIVIYIERSGLVKIEHQSEHGLSYGSIDFHVKNHFPMPSDFEAFINEFVWIYEKDQKPHPIP